MGVRIDATARVAPTAELADGVVVGPYCVIGPHVRIGEGTELRSHVVIDGFVTIGRQNVIYPFVTIGLEPQDVKYGGEPTRVEIGDHNLIREFVSIHRGTPGGRGVTTVGNHVFLMAYAHVAHDCQVGDYVIMTNAASLAGHVVVEDHAVIGAFSGIHQFCRVGQYSFIGAFSAVSQDVLPFAKVAGNRARVYGVNTLGLRRGGFTTEVIDLIKRAFILLLRSRLPIPEALRRIRTELPPHPELEALCRFVETSQRGIVQ